jgi:hypothetical protein
MLLFRFNIASKVFVVGAALVENILGCILLNKGKPFVFVGFATKDKSYFFY